jgi:hypothetical protein
VRSEEYANYAAWAQHYAKRDALADILQADASLSASGLRGRHNVVLGWVVCKLVETG